MLPSFLPESHHQESADTVASIVAEYNNGGPSLSVVSGPIVNLPNGYYIVDGTRRYVHNGKTCRLCPGKNNTCIYISKNGLCGQCQRGTTYPVFSDETFSVFPSGKLRCCVMKGNQRCLDAVYGGGIKCMYHSGRFKCALAHCNNMRSPKETHCCVHAVQKRVHYTIVQ